MGHRLFKRRSLEMRGGWPNSCCFLECYLQDLFITARSILVQLPSSFFSICLVSVYVVHPYNSIDTIAAWKKLRFILSEWSVLHMTYSLSINIDTFASRVLISFSVYETLLPRYVNLPTRFRDPPLSAEMFPFLFWLKHIYSVLSAWRPMPPATFSR